MKISTDERDLLRFFMPVTKYRKDEETNEHWITGRGSDTAQDREGDRIDLSLLQSWADQINQSEIGIGSFPNHDIHINNIAAVHKEAYIETDENRINYLLINSILNPAHPQFEYYLSLLKMKAPLFYSICVLNPLFQENEGSRKIVGGELISIDFVPVPANTRTWVSMKGGSFLEFMEFLQFENYAGNREEDIMQEKDEKRIEKIEEALTSLEKKLDKFLEQPTEEITKDQNSGKSPADIFFEKLDALEKKIEKLSKESTGRDSGTPIIDITEKEWKEMEQLDKSNAWRYLIKGDY
jgi:hypothetical protein